MISAPELGFKTRKSTQNALLYIKDKILTNVKTKLTQLAFPLIKKKTFNSVQHDLLLEMLNNFCDPAFLLMKNYLSKGCQYVSLNRLQYKRLTIKYGVPQRSILGSLLFLVYIIGISNIPGSPDLVTHVVDTNTFFSDIAASYLEKAEINIWLYSLCG